MGGGGYVFLEYKFWKNSVISVMGGILGLYVVMAQAFIA